MSCTNVSASVCRLFLDSWKQDALKDRFPWRVLDTTTSLVQGQGWCRAMKGTMQLASLTRLQTVGICFAHKLLAYFTGRHLSTLSKTLLPEWNHTKKNKVVVCHCHIFLSKSDKNQMINFELMVCRWFLELDFLFVVARYNWLLAHKSKN